MRALHWGRRGATADWTEAIVQWVEDAKAPERVIATKMESGRYAAQCAPIRKSQCNGSGSTDDEKNFACR
jgi:hypothetical protein